MASTRSKKRSSSSAKRGKAAFVPHERKKEVMGLILMALALLVAIALVTYTPADDPVARAFSLDEALSPSNNRASNALGLVGASIARFMVPHFLGYVSLLLPALLFSWGYVVFRRRTPVYLPLLSLLTLVGTFLLAGLFGWLGLTLAQDLQLWSGTWGLGVAGWMQRVFGTIGSLILILLSLAVTVLMVVDHDIQRTMDRLEESVKALRAWFATWMDRQKLRQEERRKARARRREERAAIEARRAARAAQEDALRAARRAPAPHPAPSTATPPVSTPLPVHAPSEHAQPAVPTPPSVVRREALSTAHEAAVEFKVQQRVEEEKADFLEPEAEVPDDEAVPYAFPPIDLLDEPDQDEQGIDYDELEENKRVLLDKLATYNIDITAINAVVGPTVTLYELKPAPGVKISRITALEDDLAMAMAARGIRMIAPIPGKSAIGVEIPNRHREFVRIRDVIGTAKFRDAKMELPIAIGKTIEGEVFLEDLTRMPHLLIAGATGSGKSVGVNSLITGLLYRCHPANLKFVMIDPKKIELQQYARIVDHYVAMPEEAEDPIITDFTQALEVLKGCEKEMERRYDLLSKASVRGIKDYNKKVQQGTLPAEVGHEHLPYIIVIVDELADLMMTAGKDIEGPIARLAQMARAVGIHLILATQRPSVDVITGLIKANFPARIAYQVASKIDSRTILDQNGAEGLVGNGDLLYMNGSRIVRLQGPFVSVDEVEELTQFIGEQPGRGPYWLPSPAEAGDAGEEVVLGVDDADDLFEEAARIIVRSQQGSVSLLQRKLSVGYTRAARIVDQLEEAGIVGPFEGSKARQVLVADEMQLDALLNARSES